MSDEGASITIRVVRSLAYRNVKNLVIKGIDLATMTVGQLEKLICDRIQSTPGFGPYRNHKCDTLKIYTLKHGHKSNNLTMNLDHDEWILADKSATLAFAGIEDETELSFFNREEYEEFKKNPEVKW